MVYNEFSQKFNQFNKLSNNHKTQIIKIKEI